MGRLTHVCTTCSEHFTRKYSAKRHNITIHGNSAEIVPLLEYLVGRKIGRYHASDPSWYRRRSHKFGHAIATDSMRDNFRPGGLQGQYQHYRQQQDQPTSVSPYPNDQTFESQPTHITTDDEETITTLSQETILKIQELKRLIRRYPQYHHNPGGVITCVIHFYNDGDNSILVEKLEQLRTLDSAMGYTSMVDTK
jgi:hypothetical protein